MNTYTEYHFTIPAWAMSPLFNGDESGISDEDKIALDLFLDEVGLECGAGHWSYEHDDEGYYSHRNAVDGNLGNDCHDCTYIVFDK